MVRSSARVARGGAATKRAMPLDTHVGGRVRARRLLLGMSQSELGQALGVSFQQVQKYESGTNRIGASRLQQIADALHVPVAFFFEDWSTGAPAGRAAGAEPGLGDISQTMATAEGIELMKAFSKVKGKSVRRQIVRLTRAIANDTAVE